MHPVDTITKPSRVEPHLPFARAVSPFHRRESIPWETIRVSEASPEWPVAHSRDGETRDATLRRLTRPVDGLLSPTAAEAATAAVAECRERDRGRLDGTRRTFESV